jgi:hypothetical protein
MLDEEPIPTAAYGKHHEAGARDIGGPMLAARAESPRGAMHDKIQRAHNLTRTHTENMHRLGRLFDRIEGIRPEAASQDMHKESEPNGLLDAMDRLNTQNEHSAEMIGHMIAKLEELI